jgi:hypothetical protein
MKQVLIINNCTQHEVNMELTRLQDDGRIIISVVVNYTPMPTAIIVYEIKK